MKSKIIFTATAVVLLCVGVLLYATNNKSTTITAFSTEEVADNTETVSSPPEVMCTAYAYVGSDSDTGQISYLISTYYSLEEFEINRIIYRFLESRDGTVFDCPAGPSNCSAYYELCDEYGIEYYK